MKTRLSLLALLLATLIVYWPGLNGDFIYDDRTNFESLQRWAEGLIGWREVVFEHSAGPLGRSIVMATFVANVAISGMDPFGFKLTNLLLHLLSGACIYLLLARLALCDPLTRDRSRTVALIVTGIWLLHPMMVGTVLYAVQRMAILSALFMVLAMYSYVRGRQQLEHGTAGHGASWILVGVPLFTVLAALSKENGLLAPLLCAVIEWAYFRPGTGRKRPRPVKLFLIAGVLAPILGGALVLAMNPDIVLAGYANRTFTLNERVLTQGRVLFDYIGTLLLPAGGEMSLFRDDFAISTGLLKPWTTLAAWIGWLVLLGAIFGARRRLPGVFAGMLLFLVGHAMESSVFPLLIYFEHRNYLPALGLFWALASLVLYLSGRISKHLDHPRTLARVALTTLLILLAAASFARATVWQSNEALLRQSLRHHPDSRAMRMELAQIEMGRIPPDVSAAQAHYRHLLALEPASTRLIGATGLVASSCFSGQPVDPEARSILMSTQPETIDTDMVSAFRSLTGIVTRKDCPGIEAKHLARRMSEIAGTTRISPDSPLVWQLRFRAAELYEDDGMPREAITQAKLAWRGHRNQLPVAMLLVRMHLAESQTDEAASLLEEMRGVTPADDAIGQALIQRYREIIDSANENPSPDSTESK